MFGFMKKHSEKDREEKDKKKRDKKETKKVDKRKVEKPLTKEELQRLEEARKGLLKTNGSRNDGGVSHSDSNDSLGSRQSQSPRDVTPDSTPGTFTSSVKVDIGKAVRIPPPTHPKPKKGILKDKSLYGPEIPNQGVRGNPSDAVVTEENTLVNELMSGKGHPQPGTTSSRPQPATIVHPDLKHKSIKSLDTNSSAAPRTGPPRKPVTLTKPKSLPPKPDIPVIEPPSDFSDEQRLDDLIPAAPPSPAEKIYANVDLQLPSIAPPRSLKPRTIPLKRLPAGDFGFSLRKGTVLERGVSDNVERKRKVIFAEPGVKNLSSGLLPGDRLLEVNGINVENSSREELIEIIRDSGDNVVLKVQPIPELSELSMRSGIEGEEVHIAEHSVKTGTLQRTGSMRYKSRQAKTDAQLAEDKAWLQAEKVWLVHKGGFASGKLLRTKSSKGGEGEGSECTCKVKLDATDTVLDVDEEDVEKANPPQFDRVEDVATLRYLNESSVLHTTRQRYGSNLVHTNAGNSLLVINPMHPLSIYSEKVINMFRGCRAEDMPPHIYACAQQAYRHMLSARQDQSIVLAGRSGSGKSTNVRHLMHYFTVAAGSINNVINVEKLNAMFTLLDAFGNSRTVMNTSATRYTSLLSLDFDHAGLIASASVQALMFEKTRITKRPDGEPTFHVFYQMLAGVDSNLRKELLLENLTETNIFMTPLQRPEDRQKATQAWAKIQHAMAQLDVTAAESKALICVLAAVYHLGIAGATTGANNKAQFVKPAWAQKAATVLGMSQEELSRAIFSTGQQTLKPTFRGGADKPGSPDVLSAMECLEGFVTGLYNEVFNALVSLINRALSSNVRTSTSVIILDSPGFQNPATCGRQSGASFEDLCHNYINERLQLTFHDMIFTSQQDMYSQENVECDFELVTTSPQTVVSLIDKPSQQSLVRSSPLSGKKSDEQKGLLWLLDEEAIYPGSTDSTFLDRFLTMHKHEKKSTILKKKQGTGFVLKHFQGTNPVAYDVRGWLKACRENPVSRNVGAVLVDSHKEELSGLFGTFRTPGMPTTLSGSIAGMDGTSSLRRVSSMRRTFTSASAGLKRKSVSLQVKFQMDSIVETLRRTKMHFVHCLLPQHNAGLSELRASQLAPNKTVTSEDLMLSVPLMRSQLRGVELIEAIRIHRQGFPENMLFGDFRHRFDLLLPSENRPQEPVLDEKQATQSILEQLEVDRSVYRLGLSRVFFRAGSLAGLEDERDERVTGRLVHLQALCRGFLARKGLHTLKVQHLAVQCIQRNVMKLKAIEDWPWWKLYTRVRPLLNVHRTEEELQMREIELEQIKVKYEKLEKERNEYKTAADRLEAKLSDISADLAEEHTTSTHATEILESEQAERRRLEKEVKDLNGKLSSLQRTHEKTELDLYQAQMLAAQLEGELQEDEVDGDNLYQERYQRLRRESEMRIKKLEQEQDEEREQFEKDKKHIEKKLHEALMSLDEQEHLVSNWKRRQQRTAQEMADVRLHLEEQVSRNTDLEKRQRRFDNELLKVTEHLREEKAMKEKLYRERDELAAEKYAMEQQVKDLKLDYTLQEEKVNRLEKELSDVTSARHGDQEVVSLKRLKNELEIKLQEQEEELDEQAGTIQQLEQAKLRLEMGAEHVRKKHAQELEEKEEELEQVRAATHKKVKAMEGQLEEEYAERQGVLRQKRELERKLSEMGDMAPAGNKEKERKLRHELRRTKALYQDAQLVIKKHQEGAGSRTNIKQLRNQIEDLEYALQAAVKARKSAEAELQDVQQQLDDVTKAKADSENRCIHLNREKTELQGQLEDQDEDAADVMKKYTAVIKQQSTDHILIQGQSKQIEDLLAENQALKETINQFESKVQYFQDTFVDRETVTRLESKARDLESRLELEEVTRQRAENQLSRSKEQVESLTEERDKLSNDYQRSSEAQRRSERQARDARDELDDVERKQAEASQRRYQLEKKLETLEEEHEQCMSDLRLAFKRITDLQAIIEDSVVSDSEDSDLDDHLVDSDSDSDDSDVMLHSSRHAYSSRSSRIHSSSRNSASDGGTSGQDVQHIIDDSSC